MESQAKAENPSRNMVNKAAHGSRDTVVVEVPSGEQVPLLPENQKVAALGKSPPRGCPNPRKRMVVLIILVVQAVITPMLVRWSKLEEAGAPPGEKFVSPVSVFFSECMKFVLSVGLTLKDARLSPSRFSVLLQETFLGGLVNNLLIALLSTIYVVQQNLMFLAMTYVSPATYQVVFQLRLLITAVLSVLIMKKVVSRNRWAAIVVLTVGVTLIEFPKEWTGSRSSPVPAASSTVTTTTMPIVTGDLNPTDSIGHIGRIVLLLLPCVTSGFSGVLLEFILKTSNVWARNIQLAIVGMAMNVLIVYIFFWERVSQFGLLQGFTTLVWVTTAMQAVHGLLVAAILKHADIIVKSVAQAFALVIAVFVSYFAFNDVDLTWLYIIGTSLVTVAVVVYALDLPVLPSCSRRKPKPSLEVV